MMRKTVIAAVLLALGCNATAFGAQNDVVIKLDERNVVLKEDIVYEDGRMMLPVRAMADVLGADVTYDTSTRTALVEKQMKTVLDADNQPLVWQVSLGLDSNYLDGHPRTAVGNKTAGGEQSGVSAFKRIGGSHESGCGMEHRRSEGLCETDFCQNAERFSAAQWQL